MKKHKHGTIGPRIYSDVCALTTKGVTASAAFRRVAKRRGTTESNVSNHFYAMRKKGSTAAKIMNNARDLIKSSVVFDVRPITLLEQIGEVIKERKTEMEVLRANAARVDAVRAALA